MAGYVDRSAWDGTKPLTGLGPRTLGSLALATVGCSVYTDIEKKRSAHDEGLGGIVLDIRTAATAVDEETGEVRAVRAFYCYDPVARFDLAFRTVTEDEVGQDGVEATDSRVLAFAIRKFCREVGRGRSLITGTDAELVAHAHHLTAALMGGTY